MLVDLLFDFTGIEYAIVSQATAAAIRPGLMMAVATRAHLIAMKVLAFRDKDRIDIEYLLEFATKAELGTARRALAAISRVGREPQRDLVGDLDAIVAERAARPVDFIKVPRSKWPKGWGAPPKGARKTKSR